MSKDIKDTAKKSAASSNVNNGNESKKGDGGLKKSMLAAMILPLILVVMGLVIAGGITYRHSLQKEIMKRQRDVAEIVLAYYDNVDSGDYNLLVDEGKKATYLRKGNTVISEDTYFIDTVAELSETEITLFFYDTRMMTTLENSSGKRITGTIANKTIIDNVINAKSEHFFDDVTIEHVRYCADYIPIFSKSGTCLGMIAVLEPYDSVTGPLNSVMLIFGIITVLAMLVLVGFMIRYINNLVTILQYIRDFLGKIAGADLDSDLKMQVLERQDELGDMGRESQKLRTSLKKLIEKDPLTNLNNRRSGLTKIAQIRTKADRNAMRYSIAMGDIDFFKKVNDTYGHDAGDEVLKAVANILSNSMIGKGTVIRWGGEEFLFAFDGCGEEEAGETLRSMLDKIRETVVNFDGQEIRFTMSYGVIEGDLNRSAEQDINLADERLYYAKEHGRNRVVTGIEFAEE